MARTLSRPPLYEGDFVAWPEEQAAPLRAGRLQELDIENIAEELEGMARGDRRELFNRFEVLLRHLLKDEFQPGRRTRSRDLTIAERRARLRRLLRESPGLRCGLDTVVREACDEAVHSAATETSLPHGTFPLEPRYSIEQILGSE